MDVFLLQHIPHSDGYRELICICLTDNLCEYKVNPGCDKGCQNRIDDNGLRQGDGHLGEDLELGSSIEEGSFIE